MKYENSDLFKIRKVRKHNELTKQKALKDIKSKCNTNSESYKYFIKFNAVNVTLKRSLKKTIIFHY